MFNRMGTYSGETRDETGYQLENTTGANNEVR